MPAGSNETKIMCYELRSDFSKQLKVIVIGNFVIVIVIGKMKCNCNLIVIDKNVIDPCLLPTLVSPLGVTSFEFHQDL